MTGSCCVRCLSAVDTTRGDERSHLGLGVRPDPATSPQALHEAPVLHSEDAEAMRRQSGLAKESFDFGQEVRLHGRKLHALACMSTHAITFERRSTTRASIAAMEKDGWRARLEAVIAREGWSKRALSLHCGYGPNFLQQMFNDRKDPGFSKVAKVLDALGAGNMLYVISGIELTAEDQEMLKVFLSLPPDVRPQVIEMFRAIQASKGWPEPELSVVS